jgi:hypothetical protein
VKPGGIGEITVLVLAACGLAFLVKTRLKTNNPDSALPSGPRTNTIPAAVPFLFALEEVMITFRLLSRGGTSRLGVILAVVVAVVAPARLGAGDNQDLKQEVERLRRQLDQQTQDVKLLKVQLEAMRVSNARLTEEIKDLQEVVQKREKAILQIQADRNAALAQAVQARNERDAAITRNESLVERLRELEVQLARLTAGKVQPKAADVPNPPAANVRGKVTAVDKKNRDLVKINVGSDNGLAVGHTLEVYRLKPPVYLGMIRIMPR